MPLSLFSKKSNNVVLVSFWTGTTGRTYAYDHYIDDFDYFYICGDDTYVLVDHMRHFLLGDHMKRLQNGYLDKFSLFLRTEGRI
jgi:hypothetical protein